MVNLWWLLLFHYFYVLYERKIYSFSKVYSLEKFIVFLFFIEIVVNLSAVEYLRVNAHQLLDIFQANVVYEGPSKEE